MEEEQPVLDPTLQNILDKNSLKWIFVGGKGGVGKTTCSSALAVKLAEVRKSVLLLSTDPAHNLSDAFGQKFGKTPNIVNGFKNLWAMEVDVKGEDERLQEMKDASANPFFADMTTAMPGIDEAMSFAKVLELVQSLEYECVVFDTAPTGHTLRLLSFPSTLQKMLGKVLGLKSSFGGLFTQISNMVGKSEETEESVNDKLESTRKVIEEVHQQFKDPALTTFVCVCIPEFLSLYETERMLQDLAKFEIDSCNVVVNQVLYPEQDKDCRLCTARAKMQKKYLDDIFSLYDLFHVVVVPLQEQEVRGVDALKSFTKFLFTPRAPPK